MSNLIYQLPNDNLSPVSTGGGSAWTLNTGTQDANWPAANLALLNPAKPAKLTTTTGSWVRDLGSAKQVDLFALIHSNLTAGLNVRIQGHTSNAWGAPTLDQAITIPAYMEDGFPFGSFLDLTGIGSRTFQWWRFVVVGTNAAAVAVGEIWLGATKRQLTQNIEWGSHFLDTHPLYETKTFHGSSLIYDSGTKLRQVLGTVDQTDAAFATLRSLHRSCSGRVKPTLIVVDPSINDAMMVRHTSQTFDHQQNFIDRNSVAVGWDELAKGLAL